MPQIVRDDVHTSVSLMALCFRYCECFANGEFCDQDCNCQNCHNTLNHEEARTQAIKVDDMSLTSGVALPLTLICRLASVETLSLSILKSGNQELYGRVADTGEFLIVIGFFC